MDSSHKPTTFSTHESWHWSTLTSLSSIPWRLIAHFVGSRHSWLQHQYDTISAIWTIWNRQAPNSPCNTIGVLWQDHQFLGLKPKSGIWPASSFGKDVIRGIIDEGIGQRAKVYRTKECHQCQREMEGKCENGTTFVSSSYSRKAHWRQVL